jgi:hypothetical protein
MPPLSEADRPAIIEAIRELLRQIRNPPAPDWQAPPWLIAHEEKTTSGQQEDAHWRKSVPPHDWLITVAGEVLLDRLAPSTGHWSNSTEDILNSALPKDDRVTLLLLRDRVQRGASGASSRQEAHLLYITNLEALLARLEQSRPPEDDCPPLMEKDLSILRYLADRYPSAATRIEISGSISVSRHTIAERFELFREWELIYTPQGERQGVLLTSKGLALVKHLKEKKLIAAH